MAKIMDSSGGEKPKGRLFGSVLPSVWFLKLRSFRRKSRSVDMNEQAMIPDSAPFLPKTVENIYKHGSEICTFSPLQAPQLVMSPGGVDDQNPVVTAFSTTPKSVGEIRTTRATPVTSSVATTTATTASSSFSRCMYRSTLFSGLKSLCKLVGDESLSTKSSSQSIQLRKSATPSMRAWFLVGCGGASRPRTRHSSLDLEKESGLMEMDAESGLECIDEGTGVETTNSWPRKSESWSGANGSAPWNVDHSSNEEVVKNQVVVKKSKKKFAKNRELKKSSKAPPLPKLKPGSKPTLGHLFSTRSDTDSPRKIFPDTETESEIHIDNPKMVRLPWKTASFGSDSTLRAPSMGSEYGSLAFAETMTRKPYFGISESGALYTEDLENAGNVSDSQSLLREKVLAAERMREGSKSWRDQRKLGTKRNDAEAMKLLASLDQALDQRNLKRLVEDEAEDSGSVFGSPRFELHNSPVFESFLESSAKAWGIEIPALKTDDAKTSGSISDQTRELHCVTVHTSASQHGEKLGRDSDRRGDQTTTTRAMRVNTSSPAKGSRKVKRPGDSKDASKRPSPSRKSTLSKNSAREERTIHPQREESMVDPELHDEFNHARRKFNEARKRAKQRRSKQVASVPSPPAPKQLQQAPAPAPVPKERVAVVVESSYDPYNDFRQSMIEMIVDQDIHETGDLEELLQCYLSLNEPEYHNVIVDVFTDVWHELFEGNS